MTISSTLIKPVNAETFKPHHMSATAEDLAGNQGIGRYILLPGSNGRAERIAEHFNDVQVKTHPRGHHLYMGTIKHQAKKIDVATIQSGMGCPSMEIILHELFQLGAKRFLRVGTAGSLQPDIVKIGHFVNAQASVRDEKTTHDYVPKTLPAVASSEFTIALARTAQKMNLMDRFHTGVVHCKSSFYAREFGVGPKAHKNNEYLQLLHQCGVLATEMETAALFIQGQLYDYQLRKHGVGPEFRVYAGAILGIVAVPPIHFATSQEAQETIETLIRLAIRNVKEMSNAELN